MWITIFVFYKIYPYLASMNAYLSTGSKISYKLKAAEEKLREHKYIVTRHVRDGQVFGLEVFGDALWHLGKVRSIVGSGYRLVLNTNQQVVLIK